MNDTDSKIYDPLKRFYDNRRRKVHGQKVLEDYAPPGLVEAVGAFLPEFAALAENTEPPVPLDETQEAATLQETYYRTAEMSLAIQLATVRHSDVRDLLKPRIGDAPEDHLENMLGMSHRLEEHAATLKDRKIVVKLDKIHEPAAVAAQAEKHVAAVHALEGRATTQSSRTARIQQSRKAGAELQKRVNNLVKSLFHNDRATQLECGLTEREGARKKAEPKDAASADKKKADGKSEADKKKADGRSEADKKNAPEAKAEPPKEASPPAPGPVASGTAGSAPTATASANGSPDTTATPAAASPTTGTTK